MVKVPAEIYSFKRGSNESIHFLQAVDVSLATAAMPGRVAKIEGITRALEQGSLKLRVRDSGSERVLRRSSIMQVQPVPLGYCYFVLSHGGFPAPSHSITSWMH